MNSRADSDLAVIGGGVIGWSCAWHAVRRGLQVTVFDPEPGSGASGVAAGMLAPVTELNHGEEPLLRLSLVAARGFADFASEVEAAAGVTVGYRACGTLTVAADAGDLAALDDLHEVQVGLGLEVERLSGRECRRREPFLAPTVRGGSLAHGDHQVDGRRLLAALRVAAAAEGVEIVRESVGVVVDGERVSGVRRTGGRLHASPHVLLAAGCRSGPDALSIEGLEAGRGAGVLPPVRPVKGQILRLRAPERSSLPLTGTVRGTVHGNAVYLVPRSDGELVVGATTEEVGFDERVTAGAVYELLRDAQALVPGVSELELVETAARLRPASPDHAPIIGSTEVAGLVVATGHHRNGVLLSGVTGAGVAALLVDGAPPTELGAFTPDRFSHSEVPA